MSDVNKAIETQLKNIEKKTGKTLAELKAFVLASGLTKHGEIRDMLKKELSLGHGDANTLTHLALESDGQRAAEAKGVTIEDVVDELYSGSKTGLRPIHDQLLAAFTSWGTFEVAPKKGYVSLRRKKQFAMITPAAGRVEVGLNVKGLEATERLVALPAGGMCQYKVKLTQVAEVDEELLGWLKLAFENAA